MSLREDQLSDANAVFDEWTTKYPFLKTFTQPGIPRTISAADLIGFTAPDEQWLSQTRPLRSRSRQVGTEPSGMRVQTGGAETQSNYTVQFDPTTEQADKANIARGLPKGAQATGTTYQIKLYIAWEHADPPPPWNCAKFIVKA
jgi:hypothetical protein